VHRAFESPVISEEPRKRFRCSDSYTRQHGLHRQPCHGAPIADLGMEEHLTVAP